MVLSIQEYESMRFARNADCRRQCSKMGRNKIHEWMDEDDVISEREAIDRFHRVATVESSGGPWDAKHYIFRLNADGSVTYIESVSMGQGFMAFSSRLGDALACRCCRHPLKVVK